MEEMNQQAKTKSGRKKVALLGTVPHKMKAPFGNQEFDIWAIAHACIGEIPLRVDRIFELHKWDEVVKWGSPQAWATFPHAPVYLIEARPDVPNSISYPFDYIQERFQIFDDRKEINMTNSISWMIAMAIDEGYEEIHIYGVNMSHQTEYGTQKPSCEYYLGLAKGLGKKIYVPPESDLMKTSFLYGIDEERQSAIEFTITDHMKFLESQFNGLNMQMEQMRDARNQHIGAIENCKMMLIKFKQ